MANLDLTTIEGIEKAKKHWKAEERERIINEIRNEIPHTPEENDFKERLFEKLRDGK